MMVSAADKDKSGYLDKEEFLALVARKWEHLEEVSNFKFKKIYFSYANPRFKTASSSNI